MGKNATPPPVPDYAGAAKAQGAANVETAIATAKLGNPNFYGPLGSQTISYGTKNNKIDQAGYDAAVADWNYDNQNGYARDYPDIAKFTSPDFDIPTITQTLTPDAQATLNAQQGVERSLSELGQQGVGQAKAILGTPFNPNLPGIDTSIAESVSPVNQAAFNAGSAQRSVAGPNLQQGIAGSVSPVNQAAYNAGNAQRSVAGPTFQQGIDTSGIAAMPVNAGMTGQQAIMSRLQPQLTQNENATRQRLANQGLVTGGEAYENEMRTMGQNRNDLELQAAAQGINLDAMMNQQGFGQAQARGQFGNEAQQSQFNAALQNANMGNTALQQDYQNQLAGQTAQNAAIAQNYNQQLGLAQFGNEAQLNQFQAALQNAGMGNTALQQDYQNQLAAQTAQNAAIAQNYNQQMGMAQFGNEAQQQSLDQQLTLRNQPLNQITGLMSGSQIQMPQFQGYQGANIAAAPIYQGVQDTFQGQMDQYGIRQQAKNNLTSGLMSLGGSIGGGMMM
jgi:hypothetical protein